MPASSKTNGRRISMLARTVIVLTIALVLALLLVGCGTVARGVAKEGAEAGARTVAERHEGNGATPTASHGLDRARSVAQRNRATAEAATPTAVVTAAPPTRVAVTPTAVATLTPTLTAIPAEVPENQGSTHKAEIAQDEAENLWPPEVQEQIRAYKSERTFSLGTKFEDCFIPRMATSMLDPKPEEWSRLPKAEKDMTDEELLEIWRALEPHYLAPLLEECFVYAYGTVHASYGADDAQRLSSSQFTSLYMLAIGMFGDIQVQICEESHEEYVHRKLARMAEVYGNSPAHAGVSYTDYGDPDISGPIQHGLIYTKHLGVHVCP